jgi:type IV pilus assembly protein PilA
MNQMTLLSAYLSKSKVKKVLATKPGQEGFSLIELVVVVAVLAILSAIAIPNFTNIADKARAAAASNTLATIAKECAVKLADPGSGTFVVPNLKGYERSTGGTTQQANAGFLYGTTYTAAGGTPACSDDIVLTFESEDEAKYPSFSYDTDSGAKVCNATGDALERGCSGSPGVW